MTTEDAVIVQTCCDPNLFWVIYKKHIPGRKTIEEMLAANKICRQVEPKIGKVS